MLHKNNTFYTAHKIYYKTISNNYKYPFSRFVRSGTDLICFKWFCFHIITLSLSNICKIFYILCMFAIFFNTQMAIIFLSYIWIFNKFARLLFGFFFCFFCCWHLLLLYIFIFFLYKIWSFQLHTIFYYLWIILFFWWALKHWKIMILSFRNNFFCLKLKWYIINIKLWLINNSILYMILHNSVYKNFIQK